MGRRANSTDGRDRPIAYDLGVLCLDATEGRPGCSRPDSNSRPSPWQREEIRPSGPSRVLTWSSVHLIARLVGITVYHRTPTANGLLANERAGRTRSQRALARHPRPIWKEAYSSLQTATTARSGPTIVPGSRPALYRHDRPVIAQTSRSPRQVQLRRFLEGCDVVAQIQPKPKPTAVGVLHAKSPTADVVDAHLALTAARTGAVVITIDPTDLRTLAEYFDPGSKSARPPVRPMSATATRPGRDITGERVATLPTMCRRHSRCL